MSPGDELRRLAKAATPGPWRFDERVGYVAVYPGPVQGCLAAPTDYLVHTAQGRWVGEPGHWENEPERVVDAAYIAAANPATLLRLLDDLDALRAYAQHAKFCNYAPTYPDAPVATCDCGFDAALAATGDGQP